MRLWVAIAVAAVSACGGKHVSPDASTTGSDGRSNDGAMTDGTSTDALPNTCDVPPGGANCMGVTFQCDDAADCQMQVCCFLRNGTNVNGSSCRPSCMTGVPQMCSTTAECGANGPCVTHTCNGFTFGFCGATPPSGCT